MNLNFKVCYNHSAVLVHKYIVEPNTGAAVCVSSIKPLSQYLVKLCFCNLII